MKINRITTLLLSLVCAVSVMAEAVITFEKQRHNFGDVQEKGGTVTCDFNFVNTGDEPLIINKVRTSCGCTVPEYTKDAIAPGDSGTIKITFNPEGRPGEFSKSINVFANTTPDRTILRIIGQVIKDKVAETKEEYAYQLGDIAMKTLHVSFDKIVKGSTRVEELEIANVSTTPLSPCATRVPSHIRVEIIPDTLQVGEKGIMRVTYDAAAIDDWGFRRDEFKLEGIMPEGSTEVADLFDKITVSGTLQEDFDSYTPEQRDNAPVLVVGRNTVDFKVVNGIERVKREVYLFNGGNTPLVIHKVRSDNTILTTQLKKSTIKPGQSTKLVIELDPMRARSNAVRSDIFIVSNDPENPSQSITIKAELR